MIYLKIGGKFKRNGKRKFKNMREFCATITKSKIKAMKSNLRIFGKIMMVKTTRMNNKNSKNSTIRTIRMISKNSSKIIC